MFYLVVSEVSYRYVKNIVDYTWGEIRIRSGGMAKLVICESVDSVDFEYGSIAFIIGEPFKGFQRRAGVKYIFINFSVLLMLGSPFSSSLGAYRTIERKRRLLESKLRCFDYVLDYWPIQANSLSAKLRRFGVPVGFFPIGIRATEKPDLLPLNRRKYDVCFVGGMSPRREKMLSQIRTAGASLSPSSGVDLEEAARDSRIVLNLRSFRSNHFELPRILGAFSSGAALVTETTYTMSESVPDNTYVASQVSTLSRKVVDLLSDQDRMNCLGSAGHEWLSGERTRQCTRHWADLFDDVVKRFGT